MTIEGGSGELRPDPAPPRPRLPERDTDAEPEPEPPEPEETVEDESARLPYTMVPLRVTVGAGAMLPKGGLTSSASGAYDLDADADAREGDVGDTRDGMAGASRRIEEGPSTAEMEERGEMRNGERELRAVQRGRKWFGGHIQCEGVQLGIWWLLVGRNVYGCVGRVVIGVRTREDARNTMRMAMAMATAVE
jgi:hypothetical protein